MKIALLNGEEESEMRHARASLYCVMAFICVALLSLGCRRPKPFSLQDHAYVGRVHRHVVECHILAHAGVIDGAFTDPSIVAGFLVNYTTGEPNEPKFTWADLSGKFLVRTRRRPPSSRSFTLYVNDAQGNRRELILSQEFGQKAFPPFGTYSREMCLAFWNNHVEPNLAELQMPDGQTL